MYDADVDDADEDTDVDLAAVVDEELKAEDDAAAIAATPHGDDDWANHAAKGFPDGPPRELRSHDHPALAERRCQGKRCLKKFLPTHHLQKFCPACRGLRVATPSAIGGGPATSWWASATSREDFDKRVREEADRMSSSKTARSVPGRINE